jgi:flagellar basal-body rod protein FlgC
MGFFNSSIISGSGMSVSRQIMDLITENLANVNTIQSDDGGPYRRKVPVIGTKQTGAFERILGQQMQDVVYVSNISRDNSPPRLDYDPTHPLADEKGYVKKPNINVSLEMVNMLDATRAYEANVAAYNTSKSMASKALQIGA